MAKLMYSKPIWSWMYDGLSIFHHLSPILQVSRKYTTGWWNQDMGTSLWWYWLMTRVMMRTGDTLIWSRIQSGRLWGTYSSLPWTKTSIFLTAGEFIVPSSSKWWLDLQIWLHLYLCLSNLVPRPLPGCLSLMVHPCRGEPGNRASVLVRSDTQFTYLAMWGFSLLVSSSSSVGGSIYLGEWKVLGLNFSWVQGFLSSFIWWVYMHVFICPLIVGMGGPFRSVIGSCCFSVLCVFTAQTWWSRNKKGMFKNSQTTKFAVVVNFSMWLWTHCGMMQKWVSQWDMPPVYTTSLSFSFSLLSSSLPSPPLPHHH